MSLLLSNDDGVNAPGLAALADELAVNHELRVIAPDRDRSGVSNGLTLDRPLQMSVLGNNYIAVDGTPTDCIHLGTAEIFMPLPKRVISGINLGPNLGDDVLYSGTVAAAMEGRFLELPALAVSLATTDIHGSINTDYFKTAAKITALLLEMLNAINVAPRTVFNINIPDLALDRIKGVKLTVLGQRLRGENPISVQNPRGKTLYWIGRAGGPVEAKQGTDFHAIDQGYISLTPIHADMTSLDQFDAIARVVDASMANWQHKLDTLLEKVS
ncbi:MAG: 5'/3'-nucleotidase SurE [Pseudohongiellaceae bacterium]